MDNADVRNKAVSHLSTKVAATPRELVATSTVVTSAELTLSGDKSA